MQMQMHDSNLHHATATFRLPAAHIDGDKGVRLYVYGQGRERKRAR
jgi:hypothetical protein